MILGIILLVGILVPFLVDMVNIEARWTVRESRKSKAFELAEAGIDRGLWKIRESTAHWDTIVGGSTLGGYNNDTIYADIPGGSYRIKISKGADDSEIIVVATGKDGSANEFRAIQAKLKKDAIVAAIFAPTISVGGSAKVFWGPLMSIAEISIDGSANELYPRKMARTYITRTGGPSSYRASCCWDTATEDGSAGSNTDGLEWWSYNSYPVPDPPTINLNYYKSSAAATGYHWTASSCPPSGTLTFTNIQDNVNRVRYIEDCDAKFSGTKHLRGYLFVINGDLELSGSGLSTSGYGCYDAKPPQEAWREYMKNTPNGGDSCVSDTSGGGGNGAAYDGPDYADGNDSERDKDCKHQYPGDEGYQTVVSTFNFCSGCVGQGHSSNMGGASSEPVAFKGLIFVRGGLSATGSVKIHGAVFIDTGGSWSSGSFEIYYDDSIQVEMTNPNFTQTSWSEISPTTF